MAEISIRKIDSTVEKRIITGMIVSKRYLADVYSLTNLEYFKNQYARTVAEWCMTFFDSYEEAPFNDIKNIYRDHLESKKITEEDAQIIEVLLLDVSDKYKDQKFNEDYLLDQTIEYFKKRELEITSSNIKILLDQNNVEAAEREVINFHKLSRVSSSWFNPFDADEVEKTFEEEKPLLKLPGAFGHFLGPFSQGWLVALAGGFKKGKTWLLQEMGITGVLDFLKVASVSLEMNKAQMKTRTYKRLISAADGQTMLVFPVFDCILNQSGSCNKAERKSSVALFQGDDLVLPKFDPEDDNQKQYVPCDVCSRTPDYQFSTWYELIERPPYDYWEVSEQMKNYNKMYKNNLRIICYPRFTANMGDIEKDLDILEDREGFVPHIITVDYAGILAPERTGLMGVQKEDESWMALAAMAAKRRALVVSPDQVTREGLDAASLKEKHMARWIGKLGHVDALYGINQTNEEKRRGFSRINTLAHRHRDFDPDRECCLLQQLTAGQVHLSSKII